jgi:hypothetical protein
MYGVGCVMTVDTKNQSLVSLHISRSKKWVIFCITQRASDSMAGTKDWLPVDTTKYFCSSESRFLLKTGLLKMLEEKEMY